MSITSSSKLQQQTIWIKAIQHNISKLTSESEQSKFIDFCNSLQDKPVIFKSFEANHFRKYNILPVDPNSIITLADQLIHKFKMETNPEAFTKADILKMFDQMASSATSKAIAPKAAPIIKIAEPGRFSG